MSQAAIDVYLISGFLGAGKTTLLNRMLNEVPRDMKLMVLMNEFGEEGIDGTLVDDPELDMVEISKGSIFCACVKGDFIKALYRIAFVLQPEVLVMEASGVANPTDIGRDLFNPVFKDSYRSLEKFCLLDAENFLEQYEVFYALEKQIEAADKFIVNKMDQCDEGKLAKIKEVVLNHNPKASFVETTYAQVDLTDIFEQKEREENEPDESPASEAVSEPDTADEAPILSEEELDELVDAMLDDAAAQLTPPDALLSFTCRWATGSLEDFRKVADNLPPDVVRAKGFVFENGRPYLYSHVGRRYEIGPYEGSKPIEGSLSRVVFIRSKFEHDDVRILFVKSGINLLL